MTTKMEIPPVSTFEHIEALAAKKVALKRPRAALVVPSETETLPAFAEAARRKLITPFVIGDEQRFRKNAEEARLTIDDYHMIDINQPDLAMKTAAKMALAGEIDLIVQGRVTPEETVAILTGGDVGFLSPGKSMSHVGVIKSPSYPKLLLVTDGLVHEQPDLKTKIDLLGNLARVGKALGITDPRTAVVTAVEAIYPQMPATTDGAVLAKMSERGQIKGLRVDGPLSFDIAVDFLAAESKGITNSDVAGQADAMLTSTKYVAQGICQAMALFGKCETANVLVGGPAPVAVNFVSEPVVSRLNSILLATLLT